MTLISESTDSREAVVALLLDDLAPPRLGSLLRGARKRGSLTRREVAARVDTTASELRRYERGDTPVPAHLIASLAECYGTDLTSQLATRATVEVDAHRVVVGTEAARLDSVDDDEVLAKYVGLVQRVRNSQPGEPIALRADDLVALSSALGHDTAEVEARIVELLGCSPREARSLHAEMLRRKLVVPVAGLVAGLAVVTGVGVAAASPAHSGHPTSVTRPAAHSAPATVAPAVTTPPTEAPAPTEAVTPTTTAAPPTTEAPAPAVAPPTTAAPAPETPAVAPAALPRPVITPDTTPMSIPPNENVTIIEP